MSGPFVEFDYQEEDVDALRRYLVETLPYMQSRLRFWRRVGVLIGIGFVLLAVSLLTEGFDKHEPILILTGSVVAAAGVGYIVERQAFQNRTRKRIVARMRKYSESGGRNPALGHCRVWVDGDKLGSSSPVGSGEMFIAQMRDLVQTDSHWFLFLTQDTAFPIPRHRILSGEPNAFIDAYKAQRARDVSNVTKE